MTTTAARIRALHAAEPDLPPAELARRCNTRPQNVHRVLGRMAPPRRPRPPVILPMNGKELAECLRKIGVTQSWAARWLGVHPNAVGAKARGTAAVQPAEAALWRLLASGEIALDRAVMLASPEPQDVEETQPENCEA